MLMVLKLILGLIGALLFFLGCRWMLNLPFMMEEKGFNPYKIIGKSNLRGDIGGMLIGGSIAIFLFLYQDIRWGAPVILLMGSVILGRVISLFVDGKCKEGLIAILVESIIITLILGIAGLSYRC